MLDSVIESSVDVRDHLAPFIDDRFDSLVPQTYERKRVLAPRGQRHP
jgi:hypothetical protein